MENTLPQADIWLLGEVSKEMAEVEFNASWTNEQWNKIVEETYEEHNSDFTHVLFEAIQDTATDLGFLSDE